MKKYQNLYVAYFLVIVITSGCGSQNTTSKNYEFLGMIIITANGLLNAKYYPSIPEKVTNEEYKELLQKNYKTMYDSLLPYNVLIKKTGDTFYVSVYDKNILVLTDWSGTENRIDCWNYKGESIPDSVLIKTNGK